MRDFPPRAWGYALSVAVAAAAVVFTLAGDGGLAVLPILSFGAAFVLAELAPVALSNASYSVSFVVALAAIVVLGPAPAALVAAFGALDLGLRERPDWCGRMVFNAAQLTLSTAAAGAAYELTGAPMGSIDAADTPRLLAGAVAAALTYFVVNTALVSAMVTLVRHVPAREVWRQNYRGVTAAHLCFSALGVLLAVLYLEIGLGAVVFLLVPLVVARRAFQAAVKMQDAYDATVRGLVRAVEAKDAFTRGHAERVARLTAMTAREYGLPERQARSIKYAALMHDVGKLCVSTRVLQKPGKLTADEYEHMKSHPVHGDEILREIDLLRPAIAGVRHHHERVDGTGYPDGLVGERIPLIARLITVCDAFDSMTSTRSYRPAKTLPEAFEELRRWENKMFDPRAVAALERAIGRNGWEAMPEEREEAPRHDAPVGAR